MSHHLFVIDLDLGDDHLADVELPPDPAEWSAADLAHFIDLYTPGVRGTLEIVLYVPTEAEART